MTTIEPVQGLYKSEILVEVSGAVAGLMDAAVALTVSREVEAPVIHRVFLSPAAARELAKALVRAAEES